MKYTIIFLTMAITLNAISSCNKDTCNDLSTFISIESNIIQLSSNQIGIDIQWEAGKVLPLAYFEAVHLITGAKDNYGNDWQNDHELVAEIKTLSEKSIRILFKEELTNQFGRPIALHLQFPDRMKYVDCVHSGSSDAYFLDISIQFEGASGDVEISSFKWEEHLVKGGK